MSKTEIKHHAGEGFFCSVTIDTDKMHITRTGYDPTDPQKALERAEKSVLRTLVMESGGTDRLLKDLRS